MIKLKFFEHCSTAEEAAARWKALSKTFHPDVNSGDNQKMAAINEEYTFVKLRFQKKEQNRRKKKEIFDWVCEKGLKGIEKNRQEIIDVVQEGAKKVMEKAWPDEKKTVQKAITGLLMDEIEDMDMVALGRRFFEQVGRMLKMDKENR